MKVQLLQHEDGESFCKRAAQGLVRNAGVNLIVPA